MRVTTAGQTHAIIARLLTSQSQLAAAQERATTGLKVAKMSDDPTSASAVVRAGGTLRGIAQYTRNAQNVAASLDAEDSALQQVGTLLDRARQLGISGNTATMNASERATAAVEVRQLLAQTVSIGNTKVGGTYLFGGTANDGRAPFDASSSTFVPSDASATGGAAVPRYPTGVRAVDVGAGGQMLDGPHDGTAVFLGYTAGAPDGTRGVLPAFRQLADALEGDPSQISAALSALDAASDGLQVRVGEVGARQNQAEAVTGGLAALQATVTQQKSDLSEVDMEQAITEMLARQTAYQSAMLASSKVMGLSLTEYLR